MTMINRRNILEKTLYGAGIYSHIVREHFPNEIVMTVKGRDCGVIRNPFHDWEPCLKVDIIRLEPEKKLCDELARHHDLSGTIPDGDALDFAERYYGKSGQFLLNHINEVMHLHLEDDYNPYGRKDEKPWGPRFSFFRAPITNTRPHKSISLSDAYAYIRGHYAAEQTRQLRAITDPNQARIYKAAHFDYATFCGQFKSRSDKEIIQPSGLICLDFDHLSDVEGLFQALLQDEYFDTELLFRSPSGHGLKWVVPIAENRMTHAEYFRRVANYIRQTYGIEVDKSGKDLSRACFLPCDPQAYINPKYAIK